MLAGCRLLPSCVKLVAEAHCKHFRCCYIGALDVLLLALVWYQLQCLMSMCC